jgi:hypothetical protein
MKHILGFPVESFPPFAVASLPVPHGYVQNKRIHWLPSYFVPANLQEMDAVLEKGPPYRRPITALSPPYRRPILVKQIQTGALGLDVETWDPAGKIASQRWPL